jgi:AcrR family transcriptional regulator
MAVEKTDTKRRAARSTRTTRKPDRAETERALMSAALELMERDGVLAGLNMQEVADVAGVNRGLIHHYFGTRQALLHAAIERGLAETADVAESRRKLGPAEKGTRQLKDFTENRRYVTLLALLALADDQFDPISWLDNRLADAKEEQAAGFYPADLDLEAMLVAWDASMLGYALLRNAAARQVDTEPEKLDRRVLKVLRRMASVRP